MQAVLSDAGDPTRLRLLYASRSPDDIILRAELAALQRSDPQQRLTVTHVVAQVRQDPLLAQPGVCACVRK